MLQAMSGLVSQGVPSVSVASMGWPCGSMPHFLSMPYGALAFSPTCESLIPLSQRVHQCGLAIWRL